MINGGIFGPKLSGKTTLAVCLSKAYWSVHKIRSLVLDPHVEQWGTQAWVTNDEEKFWPNVWKSHHCLIIVEEAAATIRRERELIPVFTRMRHCQHKLLIIGHSGMDLLPVMRQQLDVIYLFRQPDQAAKVWSDTFAQKGLMAATELNQYEFIRLQMFGVPTKMRLASPTKCPPALAEK